MSLRDCELDTAKLLEAAGLGSLADGEPNLFAGPFPTSAPDRMIACRRSGAEPPEPYISNTRLHIHRETVTVLVRGTAEPGSYTDSGNLARAAWSALFEVRPPEYIRVLAEDGGPTYLGSDDAQRPQWSFTIGLEYLSASAPGVVVPLTREASLLVEGLSVAGDTLVGRMLQLGALPFADFPSPAGHAGALLFDADAGELRVSDGSAWHAVGAPAGLPAGALTVTGVAAGEDGLTLPTGVRLRLGSNPSAYLSAPSPYDDMLETPGSLRARVLALQQGYLAGTGVGLTIASGSILGPAVRLRAGLHVSEPASGRPDSDGLLLLVENSDGLGGFVQAFGVRHDGTTVQALADATSAPGNVTANTPRGFATVPAGAGAITITSACARAGCQVQAWVQQAAADTAGPQLRTSTPTAGGSFTIHCSPPPAGPLRVAWRID